MLQKELARTKGKSYLGASATRVRQELSKVFDLLPNPNSIVASIGSLEEFGKMMNDPHISSCFQSRQAGVLSKEFAIDRKDLGEVADFAVKIINNLDVPAIIGELLQAALYGYQPAEIYWQEAEGKIVPFAILAKPPWWFNYDNDGNLRLIDPHSAKGALLPQRKFLVARHKATYDNPYGEPILAKCFWPAKFKTGGIKLWVRFCEKYGIPFAVAKIDSGMKERMGDEVKEVLDELIQDGVAVFEGDIDLSSFDFTKANSTDTFSALVHFCNTEISKAILSQTLTTEQSDTGSYAMSQTHLQVRGDVVQSDIRMVESCFNKLIKWAVDYNFGEQDIYPTFYMFEEEDVNLTLSERDAKLGQFVRFKKSYFIKQYGLDSTDFDLLPPATPSPAFAEGDSGELNIEALSKPMELAVAKMLMSAKLRIDKANSFEEALSIILNLYPELNEAEALDVMHNLMVLGDVAGQKSAE